MKEHAAIAIVVLMIISMAYAISTTSVTAPSVTAPSTFSASPDASISPDKAGGNRYTILTFSITNDTGSEIYKILIRDEENTWDSPLGGSSGGRPGIQGFSVPENWDNVADNLSRAATWLSRVADNLEEALTDIQTAGVRIEYAGENLKLAGTKLNEAVGYDNVILAGGSLNTAASHLAQVGTLLQGDTENLELIYGWLENVAGGGLLKENLQDAAENLIKGLGATGGDENTGIIMAGIALENAALCFDTENDFYREANPTDDNARGAADNLRFGMFWRVGDWFDNAAENLTLAGIYLHAAGENLPSVAIKNAGTYVGYSATNITNAATYFKRAAENIYEAGGALDNAAGWNFDNAENLAMDNQQNAINYLGGSDGPCTFGQFSDNIHGAADNMMLRPGGNDRQENILAAGENIKKAALALRAVQDSTMIEFGAKYLGTRSDSVDNMLWSAGDNLICDFTTNGRELLNITTAVSGFDNAATMLDNAATKLKATAAKLKPTCWALDEGNGAQGDVELEAENYVYQIATGGSKDFVFIWKAPNVSKTHTFTIHYFDNDNVYLAQDTVSIGIDVTEPQVVTFKVTQTGGVENVVGQVRDNGKAKITLVASEFVSELGTTYIENVGGGDNLLPPIAQSAWTTTDNITFEYEFAVGVWDDNAVQVRISATGDPWAVDKYNNENTDNAIVGIIVDTKPPIFDDQHLDNGLKELGNLPMKAQAGTGKSYRTDNYGIRNIEGIVQDNTENLTYGMPGANLKRFGYDNLNSTVLSVTITWDNTSESAVFKDNEDFWKKITLTEGLLSKITVTATDWAGNSENVYIENILFDNTPPAIAFNTINGTAWTENGQIVNDNTPEIKLTVTDAGLGVWFRGAANPDNLWVYLDNDDNIDNPLKAWGGLLDNKSAWDASTGVFENIIDNMAEKKGNGLVDGTYWIVVRASDNLVHTAADNENYAILAQSFTIDTTAPTWIQATLRAAMPITYEATGLTLWDLTTTKLTAWHIEGTAKEANSTVKIYYPDNTTLKHTIQADANGTFTLDITMPEGKHQKVYIEEIDTALNSSGRVLYGTYTVDKTAPVITLTEPTTGTTTDKAQITVSGTVVDAIVPYDELTVRIDCTGAAVSKTVYLNANGSFSATVPLVEGTNVINVIAQDQAAIQYWVGNQAPISTVSVTRTVTPTMTYVAIIIVIIALVLAAIAIFRKR